LLGCEKPAETKQLPLTVIKIKQMKKTIYLIIILIGFTNSLSSQDSIQFVLVKDINPQLYSSSGPHFFTELNENFLFVATGDSVGVELFISDGTTSGTNLLRNINTYHQIPSDPYDNSSDPHELIKLDNKVIFYANDDIYGYEPWITNGTYEGTQILKDIDIGEDSSYPENFFVYNNKIVFGADETSGAGRKLYITDGTEQNTFKLKDINNEDVYEPWNFYEYNNILYFRAEQTMYSDGLWRTDGTESGTYVIESECSNPSGFIEYNNLLFFSAEGDNIGRELWVSDGTVDGTYIYKDINEISGNGSHPSDFIIFKEKLYFKADDGIHGTELWCADGDTTYMVVDIYEDIGSLAYSIFHVYNNMLYFTARYADWADKTLWVTDGTEEGTYELLSNENTPIERPSSFIEWNNNLIFVAQKSNTENFQLWITNGISENTKQIFPDSIAGWNSVSTSELFLFNNEIYFSATYDQSIGAELYKLTDSSTINIPEIQNQSNELILYPNPVIDKLTIQIKNNVYEKNIYIQNIQGSIIYRKNINDEVATLDLSSLHSGVYIVVIKINDVLYEKKFIKI